MNKKKIVKIIITLGVIVLFSCFILNNFNIIRLKIYAYSSSNIETAKLFNRDGYISENDALKIVARCSLKNIKREVVSMKQFFKDETITDVSIELIENNQPEPNNGLPSLVPESYGTYWSIVIHAEYIDTYFNVDYYTGAILLQETLEWYS